MATNTAFPKADRRAELAVYYDRETRAWYAYALSEKGDQIGEAIHGASAEEARHDRIDALADVAFYEHLGSRDPIGTEARIWLRAAAVYGVRVIKGRPT